MSLLDSLNQRLVRHPKRVVFVEGGNPTAIQAAAEFARRDWGVGILLGNVEAIRAAAWEADCALDKVLVIDPAKAQDAEGFAQILRGLPPFKGLSPQEARTHVARCEYFGALMLVQGASDALVGGLEGNAPALGHALRQIIPLQQGAAAGEAALIEWTNRAQKEGLLVLAQGGGDAPANVAGQATLTDQLAKVAKQFSGQTPCVKILSAGDAPPILESLERGTQVLVSSEPRSVELALALLRQMAPARFHGKILLGLEKPVVLVENCATVEEVVRAAAVASLQAIACHEFFAAPL